ncbi:MAG: hypothetical protein KBT12_03110 [Bacteroidales bacterium]|nr:hypothetical protein [Candidatus Physcousia equi]
MEENLMTLTALAEACEGCLELHNNGIARVTTDDDLNVTVEMEDGRRLRVDECDQRTIENAIFEWKKQHPVFFQRIIGAMM